MPKRFLLLSARGWRTSRDKFCVVFLFCSGVFGLAWKPGGAGILFFYRDFMERQLFWGKIIFFFFFFGMGVFFGVVFFFFFFSAFPVAPPNVYTNSLLKAGLGL